MAAGQNVQESIRALEEALRQTAFEVLADRSAYDQAERLLRLAKSLKEVEGEFVKIMHPASAEEDESGCEWWGKAYPRFCVRGGRLVKEGRGKKSPLPYVQEVDQGGFDLVARWIAEHDDDAWQMGELVAGLKGELAGYKPYVVVGALGEAGFVRRVKRGAYRTAGNVSPDEWWDLLEAGPDGPKESPAAVDNSRLDEEIPF